MPLTSYGRRRFCATGGGAVVAAGLGTSEKVTYGWKRRARTRLIPDAFQAVDRTEGPVLRAVSHDAPRESRTDDRNRGDVVQRRRVKVDGRGAHGGRNAATRGRRRRGGLPRATRRGDRALGGQGGARRVGRGPSRAPHPGSPLTSGWLAVGRLGRGDALVMSSASTLNAPGSDGRVDRLDLPRQARTVAHDRCIAPQLPESASGDAQRRDEGNEYERAALPGSRHAPSLWPSAPQPVTVSTRRVTFPCSATTSADEGQRDVSHDLE